MEIDVLNMVWSKAIGKETKEEVRRILSYPVFFHEKTQFGRYKKSRVKDGSFMSKGGMFPSGFLRKIVDELKGQNIKIKNQKRLDLFDFSQLEVLPDIIPGFTLRVDQCEAVKSILKKQRGVVLFPTGTGKTVIAAAVILTIQKAYPDFNFVFIAHTTDLVSQANSFFVSAGIDSSIFKKKNTKTGIDFGIKTKVVCSVINSYAKVRMSLPSDLLPDCAIVDEVHNLSSMKGRYGTLFQELPTPMRIGFTATQQEDVVKKLTAEGLLGPVLAELNFEEASQKKILVPVKVKMKVVPYNQLIAEMKFGTSFQKRNYRDLYRKAIVRSRVRNRLIVEEAKAAVENGQSILVLVDDIEHGLNLKKMFKMVMKKDVHFAAGGVGQAVKKIIDGCRKENKEYNKRLMNINDDPKQQKELSDLIKSNLEKMSFLIEEAKGNIVTSKKDRLELKEKMKSGKIKAVIASRVWFEGINIPILSVIVNAGGKKANTKTIQIPGRGTRAVKGKEEVVLIDFLDPYPYLAEHCVRRMQLYIETGFTFI